MVRLHFYASPASGETIRILFDLVGSEFVDVGESFFDPVMVFIKDDEIEEVKELLSEVGIELQLALW